MLKAQIRHVEYFLPDGVLTNEQLARDFPDLTAEKIERMVGIRERHVARDDECASDMAVRAAEKLFATGAVQKKDIDFLLFCTQGADYILPTTACLIQDRLGLSQSIGALDVNLGCTGYVYGLSLAKGLVETGQARNVLLLTGEAVRKFVHPKDKSVSMLFGDAAAATWVAAGESAHEDIGPFVYGTDGSRGNCIIIPAGGMRRRVSDGVLVTDNNGNSRTDANVAMDGAGVFAFTIQVVPACVSALLERAGISMDDVDLFVFHQANRYMLNHLRMKIRIPEDKFVYALEHVGNTSSVSIPIALGDSVAAGRLRPGMRIMLVSFGVGLSWCACMARWRPE